MYRKQDFSSAQPPRQELTCSSDLSSCTGGYGAALRLRSSWNGATNCQVRSLAGAWSHPSRPVEHRSSSLNTGAFMYDLRPCATSALRGNWASAATQIRHAATGCYLSPARGETVDGGGGSHRSSFLKSRIPCSAMRNPSSISSAVIGTSSGALSRELSGSELGDALHADDPNKPRRHVLIRYPSGTQQGLSGTFMQGDRGSALQRSRDAFARKSGLHGSISADPEPCCFAENPGIRVAM